MDRDDAQLLAAVAGGDEAAMRQFYERHHDAAHRFARSRLNGDDAAAADVVHEAMLDVWRAAGRFEGRAHARSWLLAIVRNKAVDHIRRTGRETLAEPDETVPDGAADPETVTANAQDARRVRACLTKLKEAHRSVLHLAFYEELSYGEIAEAEGVPVGTIKTRVFHAKKLLAHCLGRRD